MDAARFRLLPGWELVSRGLEDQAAGRETIESLLLASANTRFARAGIPVTRPAGDVEWRLYELIEREVGEASAHGRYNALRRRLLSFLNTVDGARTG